MTESDELSDHQRELVSVMLDQLNTACPTENNHFGVKSAHLNAAHLLVSALEGEGEPHTKEAGNIFLTVLEPDRKPLFVLLSILCVSFIELPDETLSLLSESRPDFLEAFDTLVG